MRRNIGLDLARGLLMVYVIVVIHGIYWLNLLPQPYTSILLLEMPLIFLVSGYAFALSSKDKKVNSAYYWKYFKTRASRIFIPYFAYAVAAALLFIIYTGSTDYSVILKAWLNPWHSGAGSTFAKLNHHLWFIVPFLIVTLLMPLCIIPAINKLNTSFTLILIFLIFLITSFLEPFAIPSRSYFTHSTFYFFWSVLGYKLATGLKPSNVQLSVLIAACIIFLVTASALFNVNLDMQANKFPPNILFYIFSVIWVSITLLWATKISKERIKHLAENSFISLFIKYGYSLYLWQGIGYSIGWILLQKTNMPILSIWLISIILTIFFGVIASPLEKIKIK